MFIKILIRCNHFRFNSLFCVFIYFYICSKILVLQNLIQIFFKIGVLKFQNCLLFHRLISRCGHRLCICLERRLCSIFAGQLLQNRCCLFFRCTVRIPLCGLKIIHVISICCFPRHILASPLTLPILENDTVGITVRLIFTGQLQIVNLDCSINNLILKAMHIFMQYRVQCLAVIIIHSVLNSLPFVFKRLNSTDRHITIHLNHTICCISAFIYRKLCKPYLRGAYLPLLHCISVYYFLQKIQLFTFRKPGISGFAEHRIQMPVTYFPISGWMYSVFSHNRLPPHIPDPHFCSLNLSLR